VRSLLINPSLEKLSLKVLNALTAVKIVVKAPNALEKVSVGLGSCPLPNLKPSALTGKETYSTSVLSTSPFVHLIDPKLLLFVPSWK